jgi:hypothetical protein
MDTRQYTRYTVISNRRNSRVAKPTEIGTPDSLTGHLVPINDLSVVEARTFTRVMRRNVRGSTGVETWTTGVTQHSLSSNVYKQPEACAKGIPAAIQAQMATSLWIVTDGGVTDSIGYFDMNNSDSCRNSIPTEGMGHREW